MLNHCTFIGNLGKDPETKYLPSGAPVTNFSIAVNRNWKDKESGEKKQVTTWINCVVFNKLAEICGEYLKKGSLVYVAGEMRTRDYEDKEGVKRYVTEIVLQDMKMLDRKSDGGGKAEAQAASYGDVARGRAQAAEPAATAEPEFDDDIPF